MPPGADGVADLWAGFEDQGLKPAREQVRRRGEADRAGADDGNGERGLRNRYAP